MNKRIKKYPDIYEKCKERNRIFDKFAERYFTNLSPIYYGYDALKDGTKGYDTFLVGSDQLWLPSGLATGFYNLQFAPDENLKLHMQLVLELVRFQCIRKIKLQNI